MRIVIAPDKFKGSLTALEAARAMAEGVRQARPSARFVLCPMADGGEGTVEAIVAATGGEVREKVVAGPLPEQTVKAQWAYLPAGTLEDLEAGAALSGFVDSVHPMAVIEMAQASGLSLVRADRRDPMVTATTGTGQLILEALDYDCTRIVVGIGGSGTVDGGMGMASALGFRFFDSDGRLLTPCGGSLPRISSIDAKLRDPRLSGTRFLVASDVDNPLVGEHGAARVFGPQKGATPQQVEYLDEGLRRLGEVVERDLGIRVADMPGAGAAGGLGAGLVAFCGASITSGIRLIAGLAGLAGKIEGADLVLTGEGSFDSQTSRGKTPAGVAEIAREHGVPFVGIAGRLAGDLETSLEQGIEAFCISTGPMDLEEAMTGAESLLRSGTARLVRLLCLPVRG